VFCFQKKNENKTIINYIEVESFGIASIAIWIKRNANNGDKSIPKKIGSMFLNKRK
jgi:hypothetical protein